MIHIAICPLLHGAIAAIDDEGCLVLCEDLPIHNPGPVAWVDVEKLATQVLIARDDRHGRDPLPARIAINQCHVKHNRYSAFEKGIVLGSILAAIQKINLPSDLIPAAKWKDSMGFGSEPTVFMHESAMIDFAQHLFPTGQARSAIHAEALLLAEYSRQVLLKASSAANPSNVVPLRASA